MPSSAKIKDVSFGRSVPPSFEHLKSSRQYLNSSYTFTPTLDNFADIVDKFADIEFGDILKKGLTYFSYTCLLRKRCSPSF